MRIVVVVNARPLTIAVFSLAYLVSIIRGDVVYLSDGTRLEGDVKKGRDGWVVTDAKGKVTIVAPEKVKSFELTSAPRGPDAAVEKLYSLRRSVENVNGAADVVDRYRRFIEQNAGTEAAKEAQKDLAVWTDRQSRGLVKIANAWFTPAEVAAMRDQSFAVASEARELIKDGRIKEAEAVLAKALAVDPNNASAQYLRGILEFRAGRMPAARRAFESADAQVPNHAPTLNNLGVILSRQNQHVASLSMYDKAMEAAPLDRDILNNVAEALYALPEDTKKGQVVQRTSKRFIEQDEQLQLEMARVGQFRWGSTWVDQAKLDELKAAEGQVKGRLDELAEEFEASQARIGVIDQEVDANAREMRRIEARRYGRDINNRLTAGNLPSSYYDLEADNEKLSGERKQLAAKMQQARVAAKEIQKQLPTPKYSGVQKLIETEGTPAVFPTGAADTTSQPTTREALPADPTAHPTTTPAAR